MDLKVIKTELKALEDDWYHIHLEFNELKDLDLYIKPRIEVKLADPTIIDNSE